MLHYLKRTHADKLVAQMILKLKALFIFITVSKFFVHFLIWELSTQSLAHYFG